MNTFEDKEDKYDSLRRCVRLVMLLEAAENAGLVPLQITRLHAFAYLSNVLAPVWKLPVLEGSALKLRGGPFYPRLQNDLDSLVGIGIAIITNLSHVLDDNGRYRLEGSYQLNPRLAQDVLDILSTYDDERRLHVFVQELAYALSALSDDDLSIAVSEDATYSDSTVALHNVVDFAEWKQTNYSANAAEYFGHFLSSGARTTPGEKLHLYARHLHRRIHGGS